MLLSGSFCCSCCYSFEVTSDNCFLHFHEGRIYLGNAVSFERIKCPCERTVVLSQGLPPPASFLYLTSTWHWNICIFS